MKIVFKFLLFIIYTALIFCINSYPLIGVVLLINVMVMLISKISFIEAIQNILRLLPFILIIVIINILLGDISNAVLIGIRLGLVCNITFAFTRNFTSQQLAYSIETILAPLKVFNVNTRDIGIMISIAVVFIPILRNEVSKIKASLKSKGFNVNGINMIKNINLILMPLIVSILKRVEEIENAFISKAYISE